MTPPLPRESDSRLQLVPLAIKAADRFVGEHHRHHQPTHGHAKFALGAARDGQLVGVVICGRPCRGLDDGTRLAAVRICTHGDAHNAVSFLLSRARRAAQALGYTKPLVTYIEQGESGVSLIAAGWCRVANVKPESWNRRARPRTDKHAIVPHERWEPKAVAL
jgi:hypothetical protein